MASPQYQIQLLLLFQEERDLRFVPFASRYTVLWEENYLFECDFGKEFGEVYSLLFTHCSFLGGHRGSSRSNVTEAEVVMCFQPFAVM